MPDPSTAGADADSLEAFVGRSVHEWNNQAAALVSFAALLESGPQDAESVSLAKELRGAAARLHEGFAELDAVVRLERGQASSVPFDELASAVAFRLPVDLAVRVSSTHVPGAVRVSVSGVAIVLRCVARALLAIGVRAAELDSSAPGGVPRIELVDAAPALAPALEASARARYNESPNGLFASRLHLARVAAGRAGVRVSMSHEGERLRVTLRFDVP